MGTKAKTRKVMKSGDALIISLPQEFVRRSGLKKGDVVAVAYDSLIVIVNPNPAKGAEKNNDAESSTH